MTARSGTARIAPDSPHIAVSAQKPRWYTPTMLVRQRHELFLTAAVIFPFGTFGELRAACRQKTSRFGKTDQLGLLRGFGD